MSNDTVVAALKNLEQAAKTFIGRNPEIAQLYDRLKEQGKVAGVPAQSFDKLVLMDVAKMYMFALKDRPAREFMDSKPADAAAAASPDSRGNANEKITNDILRRYHTLQKAFDPSLDFGIDAKDQMRRMLLKEIRGAQNMDGNDIVPLSMRMTLKNVKPEGVLPLAEAIATAHYALAMTGEQTEHSAIRANGTAAMQLLYSICNQFNVEPREPDALMEALDKAKTGTALTVQDGAKPAAKDKSLDELLAEMDSLIGQDDAKRRLHAWVELVQTQKKREAAGLPNEPLSMHMVLVGPPGTGKTTFARLIGEIGHKLGLLEKGHTVELDRSQLVGKYVGHTESNTAAKVEEAMGGVLFVDEAYALGGPGSSGNDFGPKALEVILKAMEDKRDKFIVVMAGYDDEMKAMIESNTGLASRFKRFIPFKNFTGEQLVQIMEREAGRRHYELSPEARDAAKVALDAERARAGRDFGNGRLVRNMVEDMIERHAERLSKVENPTREELVRFERSDVEGLKMDQLRMQRRRTGGAVGFTTVEERVEKRPAQVELPALMPGDAAIERFRRPASPRRMAAPRPA